MRSTLFLAVAGIALVTALSAAPAGAKLHGPWGAGQPVSELNTQFLDGCPILAPDGLSLYLASNRPGAHAGLNIWVAHRPDRDAPWGAPQELPSPINSDADDFCPTPLRGDRLLFVSRRSGPGTCGMGDIYSTRLNPKHGWRDPHHFACAPAGPNSALDEQGPTVFEAEDGTTQLFFSSGSATVPGDLLVSTEFGPAAPVTELNSPGNDIQPNVRKDGREIVFSSNHAYPGAQGSQDIYRATRPSTDASWSAPENVGAPNTAQVETRPSLSWDARTLHFGRGPVGGPADIFRSTR